MAEAVWATLAYLQIPNEKTFATPAWNRPIPWGEVLKPHYATARQMLGATHNPRLWAADHLLHQMAQELGQESTFRATEVGVYFGEEGKTFPDPYFGGKGPERTGCVQCGGCMVSCRFNSKNTLPKNYLYLAEKHGAEVRAEAEVIQVRLVNGSPGVGFNLTFFPQFIVGYLGMPRRYHAYPPEFQLWNILSSAGAVILAIGYAMPTFYLLYSLVRGERAPANPWNAKGLEWETSSPPPTHNFETRPVVNEPPYNYAK